MNDDDFVVEMLECLCYFEVDVVVVDDDQFFGQYVEVECFDVGQWVGVVQFWYVGNCCDGVGVDVDVFVFEYLFVVVGSMYGDLLWCDEVVGVDDQFEVGLFECVVVDIYYFFDDVVNVCMNVCYVGNGVCWCSGGVLCVYVVCVLD